MFRPCRVTAARIGTNVVWRLDGPFVALSLRGSLLESLPDLAAEHASPCVLLRLAARASFRLDLSQPMLRATVYVPLVLYERAEGRAMKPPHAPRTCTHARNHTASRFTTAPGTAHGKPLGAQGGRPTERFARSRRGSAAELHLPGAAKRPRGRPRGNSHCCSPAAIGLRRRRGTKQRQDTRRGSRARRRTRGRGRTRHGMM